MTFSEYRLIGDAVNRAQRTAWGGLVIDMGVAILTVLITVFADADGWGELQWAVIGFTLVKTLLQTILAYVMRRWIDNSSIPTPLPPAPVPPPNEDQPVVP